MLQQIIKYESYELEGRYLIFNKVTLKCNFYYLKEGMVFEEVNLDVENGNLCFLNSLGESARFTILVRESC